jgi:superoxide reductase
MAAEKLSVYKCDLCGIMTETLHNGVGTLVCCNKPMRILRENETDAATEKHVPVIEIIPNGIKVSVGSVTHPMLEEHYIEWIELIIDNDKIYRHNLKPGELPVAEFILDAAVVSGAKSIVAREYCNLHGLWKNTK